MSAPTYQDADLILRIFEMRREPKLRESRDYMFTAPAGTFEEYVKRFPEASPHAGHWGKAFGYWDMVCHLVDKGVLSERLFNETNAEYVVLFYKYRSVIEGFREKMHNPELLKVVEKLATRHPRASLIEG